MEKSILRNCSNCSQQLRIPSGLGGMLMACPSCGHEFHTDFKLGSPSPSTAPERGSTGQPTPPERKSTFRVVV